MDNIFSCKITGISRWITCFHVGVHLFRAGKHVEVHLFSVGKHVFALDNIILAILMDNMLSRWITDYRVG